MSILPLQSAAEPHGCHAWPLRCGNGKIIYIKNLVRHTEAVMATASILRKIAVIVLGLALVCIAWSVATGKWSRHGQAEFANYYRAQVSPLIDSAEARQQQAADLALARLHEHFDHYRQGIPKFAEDITGWGTRFGIVGRSVSDLWTRFWQDEAKAVAVRTYTDEKFRALVVNETSLKQALGDTMATFSEAMDASRNRLEGEIKLVIGRSDSPIKVPALQIDQVLASAAAASRGMASQAGKDSALVGASGFVGGWIAGEAATALTAAIIVRLSAGSAVAAGSATAGGAAAGGAGGSAAGPLGTIVGLGVGLAVGAVVDWWMTEKFKHTLSAQCATFLDELERDLVNGVGGKPGLKILLEQAARHNSESYRNALFSELQKVTLP